METLTITRVFRKEKQGSKGPFESVGLQTKEYPGQWINGFGDSVTDQWKEGDKVQVELVKSGNYLNFKVPKQSKGKALPNDQLDRIERKIDKILELMGVKESPAPKVVPNEPEPGLIDPDKDYSDVPF